MGRANPNYKDGSSIDNTCPLCDEYKDARANMCALCAKRGVPAKKRNYSQLPDDVILEAINNTPNFTAAAALLNVNRKTIQRVAKGHGIESKRQQTPKPVDYDSVFTQIEQRSSSLRGHVLRSGVITYQCSECKNPGEWMGKPLTLELDHIDGVPSNNALDNLRFLCPNCHRQTPTYGSQKRK